MAVANSQLSIDQLYQHYHPQIFAHLLKLVHHRETAEDLCQETFLKALRHWDQHDPQANIKAWLYRIATNTAYDELRRWQRISFAPLPDDEPADSNVPSPEQFADQQLVHDALQQLPACYRVPLVLHSCEGRSIGEIATTLGCSDSAVKSRLFRARERFRQVYDCN